MKSDSIWVETSTKRKNDVVDEAIRKVMTCYGSTITEITSIQSRFKHNDFWHSHVWYNYKTIEMGVTI